MANRTIKQHYIPQVYLRGFSPDYIEKNNSIEEDNFRIFTYNLDKEKQIEKAIPIKSICYEKDLYEIKDAEGNNIFTNFLEKWFGVFERKFSQYRKKLEQKVSNKSNLETKCFLSKEEKIFWSLYIVIQNLRMPQMLKIAQNVLKNIYSNKINDNQAMTISKMWCLPFFNEIQSDDAEWDIYRKLLDPLGEMSFAVGFDERARIITSDMPFYVSAQINDTAMIEYDRIIFPVTSQICIFMFNEKKYTNIYKNRLFKIDEKVLKEIIVNISASAYEKLYMNHKITEEEMNIVRNLVDFRGQKKLERNEALNGI